MTQKPLVEFSMAITPGASMRWKMTASDTKKDLYDERMTLPLYKSFIENINNKASVPEAFKSLVTSDFWKGGMPYVSISHYPDLNGEAVPGIPDSIYTDGEQLKAKGKFFDTKLGQSCFKALSEDTNTPDDKKVRVSIAFLDLAHQHGDAPVFHRNSLTDVCPQCEEGIGDKKYLDGYLVHFALTRVPVNQRASVEVDKSMAKITRKQDAASIIDPALAEELEKKAILVGKSDALVEFSDTEEVRDVSESPDQPADFIEATEIQDYPEVTVEDADLEKGKAAQKARASKYGIAVLAQGHVTKPGKWSSVPDGQWGDPVNYRYPMPDKSHAANAASRFAQEKGSYRGKGVVGKRIERREKSAGVESAKGSEEVTEKSTVLDIAPQVRDDDPSNTVAGIEPLQLNPKLWQRGSALESLNAMIEQLNGLLDTVYNRPEMAGAAHKVTDQLKNFVAVKSQALAEPMESLVNAVLAAKSMTGTDEEKLTSIQPALNALGDVIKSEVAPVKPIDPVDAITALSQKMDLLMQKYEQSQNDMTVMRAQLAQPHAAPVTTPKPRSLNPLAVRELVNKSIAVQPTASKSKLTDLVYKRAGLPVPQ